jgi:sugar phosphate isomerase/epimerase
MSTQSKQYTRREFGGLALAAGAGALVLDLPSIPFLKGVRIGVQSYSFRTMPLADAIKAMKDIGIPECELWQGHVEPRPTMEPNPAGGPPRAPEGYREELRTWRLTAPEVALREVRTSFDDAGIKVQAYNISFNDSFTDDEIDRGFVMAKAFGAKFITASSNLKTIPRLVPFVEKHKMTVAMHNHSNTKDPNEFATPESFEAALKLSKNFAINLDIGHFVAAGYDPIAFIKANNKRITNLHLKDRKKDQGANVPWGEGDTPIKEVLQLLKKEKYGIPANIEYEYKGEDAVAEVKKCYEYIKAALA